MSVYFPLIHYICNRLFPVVSFVTMLLFQHPLLSVLQSDTQLLLTQTFVIVTVRYLEHMELCFNPHVGHLQASTYAKYIAVALVKLQVVLCFRLFLFEKPLFCVIQ